MGGPRDSCQCVPSQVGHVHSLICKQDVLIAVLPHPAGFVLIYERWY